KVAGDHGGQRTSPELSRVALWSKPCAFPWPVRASISPPRTGLFVRTLARVSFAVHAEQPQSRRQLPARMARRGKRRMSQLELASEAEISTRQLSFLETGRSQASREMLLHLSEQLAFPLLQPSVVLVAGGIEPGMEEMY